jgi:hypothetical protein
MDAVERAKERAHELELARIKAGPGLPLHAGSSVGSVSSSQDFFFQLMSTSHQIFNPAPSLVSPKANLFIPPSDCNGSGTGSGDFTYNINPTGSSSLSLYSDAPF